MIPDPFRIPDDWVKTDYRTRRPFPAVPPAGAPARPTAGAGRGSLAGRAIAVLALALCATVLWPSIRGGEG